MPSQCHSWDPQKAEEITKGATQCSNQTDIFISLKLYSQRKKYKKQHVTVSKKCHPMHFVATNFVRGLGISQWHPHVHNIKDMARLNVKRLSSLILQQLYKKYFIVVGMGKKSKYSKNNLMTKNILFKKYFKTKIVSYHHQLHLVVINLTTIKCPYPSTITNTQKINQ